MYIHLFQYKNSNWNHHSQTYSKHPIRRNPQTQQIFTCSCALEAGIFWTSTGLAKKRCSQFQSWIFMNYIIYKSWVFKHLNCDSLTIQNGTLWCNLHLLDVLYTIHLVAGVLHSQKQTLTQLRFKLHKKTQQHMMQKELIPARWQTCCLYSMVKPTLKPTTSNKHPRKKCWLPSA